MGEVTGERRVVQRLRADLPIRQVNVLFATFQRTNTQDVIVSLKDDPFSEQDLVSQSVNASRIDDWAWVPFRFDSPVRAKGQVTHLVIQSPTSVPGDAVTVASSVGSGPADAESWLGDVRDGRSIAYEVFDRFSYDEAR